MDEPNTPQWNLEEDLAGIWNFRMPISNGLIVDEVMLHARKKSKMKRLRLKVPYKGFKVLSVVDGHVTAGSIAHRVVVTMRPLYKRLTERFEAALKEEEKQMPADVEDTDAYIDGCLMERLPWYWFYQNWVEPGWKPSRIIYDHVLVPSSDKSCWAGDPIGTTDDYLEIAVEYGRADEGDEARRFMDPREFLGLLFWKETCDPLYTKKGNRDKYTPPVLRAMMKSREHNRLGSPEHYDWLGLRPPLRTYKRVEWEAIRELAVHGRAWKTGFTPRPGGGPKSLIRNPLIHYTLGKLTSTCNVLAGDLAFRAGFRTFVRQAPKRKLKYRMDRIWRDETCHSGSEDSDVAVGYKDKDYTLDGTYGTWREIEQEAEWLLVNKEIQKAGKVIVFVRGTYQRPSRSKPLNRHVAILAQIGRIIDTSPLDFPERQLMTQKQPGNDRKSLIIHQHCVNNVPERAKAPYRGWRKDRGGFVELIPGGDPSEDWGIIDLNCLKPILEPKESTA